MEKRIILLFTILLIITTFIGCSAAGSRVQTKPAAAPERTVRYKAVFIVNKISDPFTYWLASEMKKSAGQYANTFLLDVLDSQGDSQKQNSLIESCIDAKYDCIIIQPNNVYEQRPYVQKAIDAGVKCLNIDARIEGVVGLSIIDANSYDLGTVLANAAVKDVPKNGTAVILTSFPEDNESSHQAFRDIFVKQRPEVNVVSDLICSTDMNENITYIKSLVKYKGRFDCVLSDSDALSMAAEIAVMGNPDFKNLLLYGEGGFPGALIDIKDGRYTGTCMTNPEEIAQKSMESVNDLLGGSQKEIHDSVGEVYVDKTNVSKWLQKYMAYGNLQN
jgi:ABC-type sugar transport system, periplasmic component